MGMPYARFAVYASISTRFRGFCGRQTRDRLRAVLVRHLDQAAG